MLQDTAPLFSDSFLSRYWEADFHLFLREHDAGVRAQLEQWAGRRREQGRKRRGLKESEEEAAFISTFFNKQWGYRASGQLDAAEPYTLRQQFPVVGAGQQGGVGRADLALGFFEGSENDIPQVLCEFKDARSGLDARQHRKGNDRSPVKQCFDYLKGANDRLYGHEPVRPAWGIVTDMNEFRLYSRTRGPGACQRFVLDPVSVDTAPALVAEGAAFQRFLFTRLFSRPMLIARAGPSPLERMMGEQGSEERELEGGFYRDYRLYRQQLFNALRTANPEFSGTSGKLVRLAQRLLDRLIFLLYCEDMGAALGFPPNLLGDMLRSGISPYDTPDSGSLWERLKGLFRAMNEGGAFGTHTINRFNGGLFSPEPELESLRVPNSLFVPHAGSGEEGPTLLYFSATYNFGVQRHDRDRRPMIDAHTLGRIFEQSITELEIMEAEAEGRASLNLLSRRKRDGVYYTPEWVADYVVRETVGPRLEELKAEAGIVPAKRPTLRALDRYESLLSTITVVDPACGSGAFLVQVLELLLAERRWVAAERERHTGRKGIYAWDDEAVYRAILTSNIYGVDINPESVEITRLALWLHTALPDRPLTALDHTIRCGNSLVGPEFEGWYRDRHTTLFESADRHEQERINVFDWERAFPEVFARGGFDCVVGNPPYVKFQNFRVVEQEVANYLATAITEVGTPRYRSTQTGNFDLYLPFVERGLELLAPTGRMGYIAPSLWMLNEYGAGLRDYIRQRRALDRWVDFKSYQVFDEATTYTALQFYTAQPARSLRYVLAPDGEIGAIEWEEADRVEYGDLPEQGAWTLLAEGERALIERLRRECRSLAERVGAGRIVVGLQTSADPIYHLERLAPGLYRYKGSNGEMANVEIEDGVMRPLVKGSGSDVGRYRRPVEAIWLLFPYEVDGEGARLLSPEEMRRRYPKGWRYLLGHEEELRARERRSFDNAEWYRFGRSQNLDKQELPKLIVPQIQLRLGCALDERGEWYLHNVAVGGVLVADPEERAYLAGVLNAPVANFVWRRTAKPFEGDYRAANRQFIAPLPVPDAGPELRAEVGRRARELQELHTRRRDRVEDLARRLRSPQMEDDVRDESWLWSDVADLDRWRAGAPAELKGRERAAWAREQRQRVVDRHLAELEPWIRPGATLAPRFAAGELTLSINGVRVLEGLYLAEAEGEMVAAQWRHLARTTSITPSTSAHRLLRSLLKLRRTNNPALAQQLLALDREIEALDANIRVREEEMNELVYSLYHLSPDERALVERGEGYTER